MQKLQFILLFQSCLAYDWKYNCADCNRHNIFGRDCNRGPKFCTECIDTYVENFDASKPTTYDVPVEKSTWSKIVIVGGSDFESRSYDCKEENEDLCKFTCFSYCNEDSNCWTGYGYKEDRTRWICKWTSSKSWTFDFGPSRTNSRGAVKNLSMFRKMNLGRSPFAAKIEQRKHDIIYNQMCHAKSTSRSMTINDYPVPMQCKDYKSSCLFGFVVDKSRNRIKQDQQGRCFCADPFKVVNNDETSTMKIDKNFHFGDIRIFNDEEKLEEQFVCKAWQKSLELDKQISNFASKLVKPDEIGDYACKRTLRAN